ncbi:MAG TPA: bifunctional phosphopantothenoylcysteine decarboxylase/phosphopantothenate--cysteine ligase CoaBC [Ktedonobacteraceae bacterium]|nr:bifunctional phosphopantothenoylcysteine decarboxylase/phosphopantothenate--cysteine ligase CoaBC [Ktedonobacteraceae bacterium]
MLANRRVIVGVSGGIASYKAVELVSRLQQAGALVDVILTEHAEEFVRPLTFSTMSHRPVYSDLWEPSGKAAETHIELGEEAELLAVVPATANTIAKLAHGIADNMLTAVALATRAPLLLAPAMHHQMYTHPATQANLALLRERGAMVVEPEVGRLASGETGVGRLPDTPVLLGAISVALARGGDLAGRRVVITAGGTQEPIDPVRYVGNRSSGKMGYALAIEARDRGAHVTLISGPVALAAPYGVDVTTVETAAQMRDAVVAAVEGKGKGERVDVLIMSAAVADYRPAQVAARKLKKEGGQGAQLYQMGEAFSLELVRTPDILATLAALLDEQSGKPASQPRLVRVGFAAETGDLVAYARAKLIAKHLDMLVANDVSRADSGFGSDTNKVLLFHANGEMEDLPVLSKTEVAARIWDRLVPMLQQA